MREPAQISFYHRIPAQVRFNDIDMMGHMTNAVHLSLCDNGRMFYFKDVFDEKVEYNEVSLVVASIKLDFFAPVFLYEELEVLTKIHTIGNKSLQMVQRIVDRNSQLVKSEIQTILSGYDYINQHSIVVPDKWKERIRVFEKL